MAYVTFDVSMILGIIGEADDCFGRLVPVLLRAVPNY